MKQRTGSGKRLEKFNMLVKSMTETNKHVCRLLLSVILLTVTVTEVAEPLRYDAVQMAEQVRYLQKEAELYRKYLQRPDRGETRMQQQMLLLRLQSKLPVRPDENSLVDQIHRKAKDCGVVVRQLKRVAGAPGSGERPGKSVSASTGEKTARSPRNNAPSGPSSGKGSGMKNIAAVRPSGSDRKQLKRVSWDAEFTGSWHGLLHLIKGLENQNPCARLDNVQIDRYRDAGLSVRGRVHIYYFDEG